MTRDQVRQLDELAVQLCGMSIDVLMENAGRGCAEVLLSLEISPSAPIVVVCGKGNNGGDGFAMARHLDLAGRDVTVAQCAPAAQLSGAAATNFHVLAHTAVRVLPVWQDGYRATLERALASAGCVGDALFGVGLQGAVRPPFDRIIAAMNGAPGKKIAIDLPSGLDCDSGQPSQTTFRADVTCTFVAEKIGFQSPAARPYLGDVRVLDIGAPRRLVESVLGGK
jgi:NAD(P)H-hydrate epimerase